MTKAYKHFPNIIKNDQRISELLMKLSNHNAIDFNIYEPQAPSDTDKIKLSDLDYHARKSFPPCMKTLYTSL